MTDPINKPAHYTVYDLEPIEVIQRWEFEDDFYMGNTIKYIGRFRHKGNPVEDLKKAVWNLNRKIERLEKQNQK
jgi:hypothetical protein